MLQWCPAPPRVSRLPSSRPLPFPPPFSVVLQLRDAVTILTRYVKIVADGDSPVTMLMVELTAGVLDTILGTFTSAAFFVVASYLELV